MTDIARLSLRIETDGMDQATRGLDKMAEKGATAELKMASLAKAVAAIGGGAAMHELYQVNQEFQRLHTQLQTFAGMKGADVVFGDLQRFAAETPFELRELTEAWITMKARGMDPSLGTMRSVGNAASALGVSFSDLNGAIASAAAGETETLKRLGFAVRSQGDTIRIAYDGMSMTVDKNARSIQAAIAQISEAKFAGGMARQVLTLGGAMSNLKDQVSATLYEMGKSGVNDAMVKAIQDTGEALKDVTPRLVEFSQTAVTGAVDAVKFVNEHQSAILALGAAYGSLKIGSVVGNLATETTKWAAAKQAAIGQSMIAKSVIIGEAEADRLAATAKAEHAALQVTLATMQANTAPAFEQVAAQTALRGAVTASNQALREQIAADIALAAAQRSAGAGASVISALGGPIGIVTGLLTLGATAWAVWGNSAEEAGDKAKKAAQEAAAATGSAATKLYDQVRALEQQKRDLQARGEAGGIIGDNRFAKADAETIKRVRQLMDSRRAAEGALEAISSGRMQFRDVNERVHAENRYAEVLHKSQKGVEELATAEARRIALNRDIADLTKDSAPSEKAAQDAAKEIRRQADAVDGLRQRYDKLVLSESELLFLDVRRMNLSPSKELEAMHIASMVNVKRDQIEAEKEFAESLKETAKGLEQIRSLDPGVTQTLEEFRTTKDWNWVRDELGKKYTDPKVIAQSQMGLLQGNKEALDPDTYTRAFRALRSEASMTWNLLEEGGTSAAKTMADAFAAWATGAKLNVRDMTASILADLAKIASQKAMSQLVNVAFNALTNTKWGGGSGGSGGSGSGGGSGVPYTGGIPDDWKFAPPPTPPSGAGGLTTLSPTVTVNITNNGSEAPVVTAQGAGRMGVVVSDLIQRAIQEECRPGGVIWETKR